MHCHPKSEKGEDIIMEEGKMPDMTVQRNLVAAQMIFGGLFSENQLDLFFISIICL